MAPYIYIHSENLDAIYRSQSEITSSATHPTWLSYDTTRRNSSPPILFNRAIWRRPRRTFALKSVRRRDLARNVGWNFRTHPLKARCSLAGVCPAAPTAGIYFGCKTRSPGRCSWFGRGCIRTRPMTDVVRSVQIVRTEEDVVPKEEIAILYFFFYGLYALQTIIII